MIAPAPPSHAHGRRRSSISRPRRPSLSSSRSQAQVHACVGALSSSPPNAPRAPAIKQIQLQSSSKQLPTLLAREPLDLSRQSGTGSVGPEEVRFEPACVGLPAGVKEDSQRNALPPPNPSPPPTAFLPPLKSSPSLVELSSTMDRLALCGYGVQAHPSAYSANKEALDGANDQYDGDDDRPTLDAFEHRFATTWLERLVASAAWWLDQDQAETEEVIERAAGLLSGSVGMRRGGDKKTDTGHADEGRDEEEDGPALLRNFSFPFCPASFRPEAAAASSSTLNISPSYALSAPSSSSFHGPRSPSSSPQVSITLNDDPVSMADPTSVGVQTWASASILAEWIAAEPDRFVLSAEFAPCAGHVDVKQPLTGQGRRGRILELGAGTGLVGMVTAKVLQLRGTLETIAPHVSSPIPPEVVLTDYHPLALKNLRDNVNRNGLRCRSNCLDSGDDEGGDGCDVGERDRVEAGTEDPVVEVRKLDWEAVYRSSLDARRLCGEALCSATDTDEDDTFDVILAADVIYSASHPSWIRACAERYLRKPPPSLSSHGPSSVAPAMHLVSALRYTPRRREELEKLEQVFGPVVDVNKRPSDSSSGFRESESGACSPSFASPSTLSSQPSDPPIHGRDEGYPRSRPQLRGQRWCLAVTQRTVLPRKPGVGRADEGGYLYYRVQWIEDWD